MQFFRDFFLPPKFRCGTLSKQINFKIMIIENREYTYSQADLDNHSNQLNPNNDEYYKSRGEK